MERKRILVGVDDFKSIIDSNGYYVDKTLYIKQLLNEYGINQTCLTLRQRRFGKTLMLSTLRYFFDIDEKENSYLFKDLAISKETKLCEKYQNKYPLIFLTFKGVIGTTKEEFIEAFNQQLYTEYERHSYVKEVLDKGDLKSYNRIINQEETVGDIKTAISFLIKILYDYHHIRPIVLVDDYDIPLNKANEEGLFAYVADIINSMFSNGFKTNENLQFALITGCLQIAKNEIHTGFNNALINTVLDSSNSSYFGFTKEETKELLTYYNLEDKYEEVLTSCGGYRIGKCELINPCSVLSFVGKKNGNSTSAYPLFDANNEALLLKILESRTLKKDFESLLSGDSIYVGIDTTVTYDTVLNNSGNIMAALLFLGYLSETEKPEGVEEKTRDYYFHHWVKIPNNEVMFCFNTIAEKYNKQLSDEKLSFIISSLLDKDIAGTSDYLNNLYSSILQARDKNSKENNYHYFLAAILALNPVNGWEYRSQDQGVDGYSDFVLLSDEGDVIIIEEKNVKELREIPQARIEAFEQIEKLNYTLAYEELGIKDILKYAIVYCDHRAYISLKGL